MTSWQDEFGRVGEPLARLGAIRRHERELTGDRQRLSTAAGEQLGELSNRLIEQQTRLSELARTMRLPVPSFQPDGPAPAADGPGAVEHHLRQAGECLRRADAAADQTGKLGDLPLLLPTWSAPARNAVIYGAWSLAGLLFQLIMIGLHQAKVVMDAFTMYSWTCCGFPAIVFLAGYLTIGFVGRARTSTDRVERNPRLGAAICAVSLPVAAMVLALLGQLF